MEDIKIKVKVKYPEMKTTMSERKNTQNGELMGDQTFQKKRLQNLKLQNKVYKIKYTEKKFKKLKELQ